MLPLLLVTVVALGARPPATTQSSDQIRAWYLQLADRDPEVREQARINLMGIKRRDLPALEKVVADSRPVRASQAAVLYDIVTHVHMAGEPYKVAPNTGGFLGLRGLQTWDSPPGIVVDDCHGVQPPRYWPVAATLRNAARVTRLSLGW